jgi:DNA (cytosine-5)-methyltransferase 1
VRYFNDNEPFACDWLSNLWPGARVDRRSITAVEPDDLLGYERVHFFAGIGGWEYALNLAGWPAGFPVWTGSCPCQPFSAAGKRKAAADERHLWPEFRRLIAECRPPVVVGEQVASRLGRDWLAGVFADLEGLGYAVAGADLCAAGVGAPHLRQRLYWVGYATGSGLTGSSRLQERRPEAGTIGAGTHGWVAHTGRARAGWHPGAALGEETGLRRAGHPDGIDRGHPSFAGGSTGWGDTWLQCLDGKARRVEPGIFPLAHGIPRRVGRLRAYGNAIVPQVAATFVRAFMEATGIVPLERAA